MSSQSVFEQIGGEAAVEAAVTIFYQKVMADERINHFFEGVDMARQHRKQVTFLSFALGGPTIPVERSMRAAHKRLVAQKGLNDSHFDIVMEHLGATLVQLKVPQPLIEQAAAICESVRADVLGKSTTSVA